MPLRSHPHEQGGILIRGQLELTIGDETRLCEAGSMFIIPPHIPHRAVAVGGPAVVLDCFSPVREDYAEMYNKYIPSLKSEETGLRIRRYRAETGSPACVRQSVSEQPAPQ